ncbi:MAG: hypothetical protein NZ455_10550 [Bacteroidia bacterium]|nr:hypothetical protein [Bacteroidia bacterium]MDW8346066.1 hypothetical protein [Bacteroidia bacterium]
MVFSEIFVTFLFFGVCLPTSCCAYVGKDMPIKKSKIILSFSLTPIKQKNEC